MRFMDLTKHRSSRRKAVPVCHHMLLIMFRRFEQMTFIWHERFFVKQALNTDLLSLISKFFFYLVNDWIFLLCAVDHNCLIWVHPKCSSSVVFLHVNTKFEISHIFVRIAHSWKGQRSMPSDAHRWCSGERTRLECYWS